MPKTVDNYIIQKFLFKDTFLSKIPPIVVQYYSCQHKILKKYFTLKKIDRPSQTQNNNNLQQNNFKNSYACSCFENQSTFPLNLQVMTSRQLKSSRVLKCLKILKSRNSIFAVYEQHPEKTLKKAISTEYLTSERSKNKFIKEQIILTEILKLVLQLHQANIAVGNINPDHIFLTSDNKILISNFLIARKIQVDQIIHIDTFLLDPKSQYLAPQLIKKGTLSKAADIFTIGKIIKSLNLQKSHPQLSSSSNLFLDSIRDYLDKMIDQNPQKRPSIQELNQNLRLNKSRKISFGSNGQKQNEQKLTDLKNFPFENYKSNASLRDLPGIEKPPILLLNESRKSPLLKRNQTLNENLLFSQRKILLKSRTSIEVDVSHRKFNKDFLQVPGNRNSREIYSPLSAKSIVSSTETQDSKRILSTKQKVQQVILMRNSVSFLLEMAQFVYGQNKSKQLGHYLIQEALSYTQNMIKLIHTIICEEKSLSSDLKQIFTKSQNEKKKLIEILEFFTDGSQFKKHDQFLYCEELKTFGKFILSCYSTDFVLISGNSQVSDSSKNSKIKLNVQKSKLKEEKLFKTLLILKKLEFGSYYDFFKAKIHHFNRKYWNEHYFEFQKSFSGKYFVIQIKDLINRK